MFTTQQVKHSKVYEGILARTTVRLSKKDLKKLRRSLSSAITDAIHRDCDFQDGFVNSFDVAYAFVWHQTPQGEKFWKDLAYSQIVIDEAI